MKPRNQDMEFVKYGSIENTYRTPTVERCQLYAGSEEWCVLEKIHGANLSFLSDGNTVQIAKRTSVLTEKEFSTFYNVQAVQRYEDNIKELYRLVVAQQDNVEYIIVYGELCGGNYPSIKSIDPLAKQVQRHVHYSPETEFFAYDIKIVEEGNAEHMNYDVVVELCEKTGVPYVPVLSRGTLTEVLEYSSMHRSDPTMIPGLLGYPLIDDNIREGHVLKPVKSVRTTRGDRVILKDKNTRFCEKSKTKIVRIVGSEIEKLAVEAATYMNDNRLDAVLSKFGEATKKDVSTLIQLLAADGLEEFRKDYELEEIEKKDLKIINKKVSKVCAMLVRKRLF